MARIKHIQANFAAGEISPNAYGRTDLDFYYAACAEAQNVMILPQGSARRRNGSVFIADMAATSKEHQLIPYRFDGHYQVVLSDFRLRVYDAEGIYQAFDVTTPWPGSALSRLQWAQYQGELVIVHPDYPPQRLLRNKTSGAFGFAPLVFTQIPTYAFEDGTPNPVTLPEWELTFVGTWAAGDTFTVECNGNFGPEETDLISWVVDEATLKNSIKSKIAQKLRDPELGFTGTVTVTGTDPTYTIELSDQFANFTIAKGSTTNAGGGTWTLTNTVVGDAIVSEDAFSVSRGWPGTVAFYNQRLYFGGTDELPQHLFGSVIGSFYDFTTGPEANDAIQVKIAGQAFSINFLASLQFLHIGTSRGDYVMDDASAPVVTFKQHTAIRSAALQPDVAGSEVLAIDDCHCRLSQLAYSDERQSWLSNDLFLAADHLPQGELVRITHAQSRFPFLFALRTDGTMLAGTYRPDGVAWAPQPLGLEVVAISTLENQDTGEESLWCVVVNSGTADPYDIDLVRIPLTADFGHGTYLDSAVVYSGTATTTLTGLDHLDGVTCGILADNAVLPDVVPSGGQITLTDAASDIVVGRRYTSRIATLPLANALPGTSMDSPVALSRIAVRLYQSGAPFLNGEEVRELVDSTDLLGTAPPLLTGNYAVPGQGYGEGTVDIETDEPLPLLVQAVYATAASHGG